MAFHFGAAGDNHIFQPRHDHARGEIHGCDSRATETVEGNAARPDVISGVKCCHAPKITALRAALSTCAPDDIVYFRGGKVVAIGNGTQHRRRQLLRVHIGQRAFTHLADTPRGANTIDNPRFGHVVSPLINQLINVLVRGSPNVQPAFENDGQIPAARLHHPWAVRMSPRLYCAALTILVTPREVRRTPRHRLQADMHLAPLTGTFRRLAPCVRHSPRRRSA